MNQIVETFKKLQLDKKTAFMPFVVAGDPSFKKSFGIIKKLLKIADLLEIGFPYSDPLADGPVIQAADERALKAGMTTGRVLRLIKQIRKISKVPITVLVYANLVFQQGINNFYRLARDAGIDGVLIPDLPVEEALPYIKAARKNGIAPIFLVTQTTSPARLRKILKYAEGYLYLVSVLGVTGARKQLPENIVSFISTTKKLSPLPLAVGFGISSRNQIEQIAKAGADGAILGSAIIQVIAKNQKSKSLNNKVENFVKKLIYKKVIDL